MTGVLFLVARASLGRRRRRSGPDVLQELFGVAIASTLLRHTQSSLVLVGSGNLLPLFLAPHRADRGVCSSCSPSRLADGVTSVTAPLTKPPRWPLALDVDLLMWAKSTLSLRELKTL